MAVETINVQASNRTGAIVALQSFTSAGGFRFLNDGMTILYVENDAGNLTLNFTIQPTVDGEAVATKDIVITASENWVMGPFPTRWYNDATDYCIVAADANLASATAAIRVVY